MGVGVEGEKMVVSVFCDGFLFYSEKISIFGLGEQTLDFEFLVISTGDICFGNNRD